MNGMKRHFSMAWRNIMRRRRRTLITAATVAGGLLISLTFTGTADWSYANMIDTSAKMGYGHVTVAPRDYFESPTINKRIHNCDAIRETVLRDGGVVDAVVRIFGQGMFATASKSVGGTMIGIDPAHDSAQRNVFISALKEGKLFTGADDPEVVIGMKLAEKLNLHIGKKLIYTSADINGEIFSGMARVGGIFRTGAETVDGGVILLPIDRLRHALHYGPQDATLIAAFIDDQRRAPEISSRLATRLRLKNAEILPWPQTQAELAGLISIDHASNVLYQFFVGLLVAAGILDTILMSVLERKHEFGVMLAVGMDPKKLFLLVLAESFYIGVLGLVIGGLIAVPWYWFMHQTGIDLASYIPEGYDAGGVPLETVLKMRLYWESLVVIMAGVFSLTLAAGLYPAWKASRIPPVESMRGI